MILAPLFVLVLMTFVLGSSSPCCAAGRCCTARSGPNRSRLREPNWPPRALQVGNSFQNQFELPVLFYVLTILALITKHADLLFVMMAWIFVLSGWPTPVSSHQQQSSRPRWRSSASARWCWRSCG